VIAHDAAVSVHGDPLALRIVLEVEADLVDEIIGLAVADDLLADLEKLVQILSAIRDLHHAVRRQLEQPVTPDRVVTPVVYVEPDLGALVERDIFRELHRTHPAREAETKVEVHVAFEGRESVQAAARAERLFDAAQERHLSHMQRTDKQHVDVTGLSFQGRRVLGRIEGGIEDRLRPEVDGRGAAVPELLTHPHVRAVRRTMVQDMIVRMEVGKIPVIGTDGSIGYAKHLIDRKSPQIVGMIRRIVVDNHGVHGMRRERLLEGAIHPYESGVPREIQIVKRLRPGIAVRIEERVVVERNEAEPGVGGGGDFPSPECCLCASLVEGVQEVHASPMLGSVPIAVLAATE